MGLQEYNLMLPVAVNKFLSCGRRSGPVLNRRALFSDNSIERERVLMKTVIIPEYVFQC